MTLTNGKRRILVVDDSPLLLDMAQTALSQAGYHVEVAHDLAELSTRQQNGGYDLILIDVQMPEAYGDDVAGLLKHVRGVDVPIYLLSSLDDEELQKRTQEAEIDGFISKRAGMRAVVERVHGILKGT